MSTNSSRISKYLARYAEPESSALLPLKDKFSRAFVLPIYDESIDDLKRFEVMPENDGLLAIWVFNCPDNGNESAKKNTQAALEYYRTFFKAKYVAEGVSVADRAQGQSLILIDRCREGSEIPHKQGVGLARKIGADIALPYLRDSAWIYFSDADASLPDDYFLPEPSEYSDDVPSAFLFPFQHRAQLGKELSCSLYDFKLRYFVDQMQRAKSPYAYHALGSIMSVLVRDYVAVRGVPKRSAGEDFYLLNKLAKVGGVMSLEAPTIELAGRESHRVPFGTGPAIESIEQTANPVNDYEYYHPVIFCELSAVLQAADALQIENVSIANFHNQIQARSNNAREVWGALQELKVDRFFEHCKKQGLSSDKFVAGFNEWFDAFLSLRFIHILRDNAYPSVSLLSLGEYQSSLSPALIDQRNSILSLRD